MKRLTLGLAALLALAPALASAAVTVKGSDTMVILAQRWAEEYMKKNAGKKVQVTGGGSGTGIAALINGTTEIANASRAIKPDEAARVRFHLMVGAIANRRQHRPIRGRNLRQVLYVAAHFYEVGLDRNPARFLRMTGDGNLHPSGKNITGQSRLRLALHEHGNRVECSVGAAPDENVAFHCPDNHILWSLRRSWSRRWCGCKRRGDNGR